MAHEESQDEVVMLAERDMEQAIQGTVVIWKAERADQRPRPRIIAGIPAYNEERSIAEVVRRTREFVDEVIVCDDGSSDDTALLAELAGARVLRHETNRGAGAATLTCFEEARRRGVDVLVTLDGDGQHNPDEIPRVLAPVERGEADLVIGSRFLARHDSMPVYRKLGIKAITWLCNVGSPQKVGDTQSCFRAYGRRALYGLNSEADGFGFSVELLIQSARIGMKIREVPITCIYNTYSHTANPVTHGIGVALATIRLRLGSGWAALLRHFRMEHARRMDGLRGMVTGNIKEVIE